MPGYTLGCPGCGADGMALPCVLAKRPELLPPDGGRALSDRDGLPEVWIAHEVRGEPNLFAMRDKWAKADWIGPYRKVLAEETRPVRRFVWNAAINRIEPAAPRDERRADARPPAG